MENRERLAVACLLGLAACAGPDVPTEDAPIPMGNTAGMAGMLQSGGTSTAAQGGSSNAAGAATIAGAAGAGSAQGGSGGGMDAAGDAGGPGAVMCVGVTEPCQTEAECCDELSCDTTSLGQVCCGRAGASCATENGEDCCGNLLCLSGECTAPDAAPSFQAPFPCGESWTYSHHGAEVRRALDFVRDEGVTNGAPVLAAAAGIATRHDQPGGAGQYIAIEHGGGWKTYYFHLQAYSVPDGTQVTQGQEVGLVGSTGASSGPHLHFEQLKDGVGQDIVLDDQPLAPYPGSYGQKSVVSNNCR